MPVAAPASKSAIARVSSTAKTKDLGIKPAVSAQPASRAARIATPSSRATPNASTNPHRASPPTVPDPRPGVASNKIVPGVHPALKQPPANASASRNGHASSARDASNGARLEALADGARFAIDGIRIVIGRSLDPADAIDIDLSRLKRGVERVSRRHAEIIQRGDDYFIRDLGSLNGTYIAGRGKLGRDQLYQLKDHDEVVLGGARLEFRKGSRG
jgi:hypothetical protein